MNKMLSIPLPAGFGGTSSANNAIPHLNESLSFKAARPASVKLAPLMESS